MRKLLSCLFPFGNRVKVGEKLLVYQGGPDEDAEHVEFNEPEPISGKSPAIRLAQMYDALEKQIQKLESSADAEKYKDAIQMARARLAPLKDFVPQEGHVEAAKPDGLSRLTKTQVDEILAGLRLSIIDTKSREMRAKLAEVAGELTREKEARMKVFDDKYAELQKKYEGWPDVLKPMADSYNIRRRYAEKIYADKVAEVTFALTQTLGSLGSDIDGVLDKFDDLDKKLFFLRKNGTERVELAKKSDEELDIPQFEAAAGKIYESKKWELIAVLSQDSIDIMQFTLDNWALFSNEQFKGSDIDPNNPAGSLVSVREKIRGEYAKLQGEGYSAKETEDMVKEAHSNFLKDMAVIRGLLDPKVVASAEQSSDRKKS